MADLIFPNGTKLSDLAPNTGNLLASITPTFTNYATSPATNAQITSEITSNTLTTAGAITANTVGKITYDLGSSKRVIVSAYSYIANPAANPAFGIYLSDDNSTYDSGSFERSEAYYPNVTTIGKARYIQIRTQGHASAQTRNDSLNVRAYNL